MWGRGHRATDYGKGKAATIPYNAMRTATEATTGTIGKRLQPSRFFLGKKEAELEENTWSSIGWRRRKGIRLEVPD